MSRATSVRGFSLIELLVVVAIIGIIAAIAIPALLRARMTANEGAAIGSLRAISSAEIGYAASAGRGAYAQLLSVLARPCPNTTLRFMPRRYLWRSAFQATDPSRRPEAARFSF